MIQTHSKVSFRGMMMAELFLEVYLGFLAFIGFRKRKKNITLGSDLQKEFECSGCHRELKRNVIYEWGKMWCKDCYKADVLKIVM